MQIQYNTPKGTEGLMFVFLKYLNSQNPQSLWQQAPDRFPLLVSEHSWGQGRAFMHSWPSVKLTVRARVPGAVSDFIKSQGHGEEGLLLVVNL